MVVAGSSKRAWSLAHPTGDALGRVPTDIAVPTEGLLR
jgi:hypothetical protein